ncbi:hypothetical protein I6E50_07345 [Roseburia hominis]|uniref:hypothetical protein n=1 Tax=Roseburia hominis TaxID=301301 RepID=UPI001F26DD3C|nr:hypothetical protein [Roseburia hominis]
MSEKRYGNLLDKYTGKESNNSNRILNDFTRSKKEEGKGKYGTLLDNVDKLPTIYDKILDVENATRRMNQEEAEKQAKHEREIKLKRERQEQELQAHIDKNNAFVEDYLAKKEAEQKAIEKKKKEEAEKADFYMRVERLMNIDPHIAETYIKAQNKF